MIAAIVGFLTALPQLVKLITEVWSYLQKVSGNDPAGFLLKSAAAFKQLNAAQTQEEHANAAKGIADLIGSLPPR